MKPIAYFSAPILASAHSFAGKNDERNFLNGVNVRPSVDGGVIISATNGHVLFACRDPEGWCKQDLILAPSKPLSSAARKRTSGLFVAANNGIGMVLDKVQSSDHEHSKHQIARAQLASPTVTTVLGTLEVIDAVFPDLAACVGGFTESDTPIIMSEGYLALMKATFSRLSDSNCISLQILSGEHQILVQSSDPAIQAVAMVMGMRFSPLPPSSTDWLVMSDDERTKG